jgi:uncharacterized protein YacL
MAAVGRFYLTSDILSSETWLTMMLSVVAAVLILALDILASRRKLMIFSGVLFGLLIGLAVAYVLGYVADWVVQESVFYPVQKLATEAQKLATEAQKKELVEFLRMLIRLACCYLCISFILQTKDDFRFIIPYVEFAKQSRGVKPVVLDTSVLIDGRIMDIASTGILDVKLLVPKFVLDELQRIADSSDRLKRNRGRRGLDILAKLQTNRKTQVLIYESAAQEESKEPVDQKLVALAGELDARVLTNDVNLLKVAQLRGIDVINLNDLAGAMRPVVLPGERLTVLLQKAGEQPGQAVGYLEDGTMVVVEQARPFIGEELEFAVTSVVQTSAGRMVFGRPDNVPKSRPRQASQRSTPTETPDSGTRA